MCGRLPFPLPTILPRATPYHIFFYKFVAHQILTFPFKFSSYLLLLLTIELFLDRYF